MNVTNKAPKVSIEDFKRTKIIATVGPATDSYESVLKLVKLGANGLRLNFSHGSHEEHGQRISWIRKASREYGKPVAIIQDLQGPKIRLGDFDGVINVRSGQSLTFKYKCDYTNTGFIPTQFDLSKKVKRGERIYLYDGKVRTTVVSVKDGLVHARVENDGILLKRKGINLPDTDFGGDTITLKDKKDLAFGSTQDIDYVAQSFVQSAADIRNMRLIMKRLGMSAKIIAKFETKSAMENMEEIVAETDVIMIARGDLAVEVAAESVPVIQRKLIGLGMKHMKPSIVATQMLFSMTESPEPTRAEVSDVATAVIVGADCVMLSDETANGKYPFEAIKVMKRIVMYTQNNSPLKAVFSDSGQVTGSQSAICSAVIELSNQLDAKAIVAETASGATALLIASRRPMRPIIVTTSSARISQQLAIVHGTKTFIRPDDKLQATKLTNWLLEKGTLSKGDIIVTASGRKPGVVGSTDTIKVRVME